MELAVGLDGLLPSGQMAEREPTRTPQAFIDLLKMLIDEDHYKSRAALGRLIGMSGSRVGRAINGLYVFNIENCLLLAEKTGLSPSVVLRASGRDNLATQLERLYGEPATAPKQTVAPKLWDVLTTEDRAHVEGYIAGLIEKGREERRSIARRAFPRSSAPERKNPRPRSTSPP